MELVTVASFPNPAAAHLLRTLLESQGIPATVVDEQTVNTILPVTVGEGGVQVQVLAEDAEEARQIIERADAEPIEDDSEYPEDDLETDEDDIETDEDDIESA